MRIAICDDEPKYVTKLNKLILNYFKEQNIKPEMFSFYKGSELFGAHKKQPFDLIFLDINMPEDMNGFQVAEAIRIFDNNVAIIYVSCENTLVYQSFKFQPFYFILKKDVDIVLKEALKKFFEKYNRLNQAYLFKTVDGRTKKVNYSHINYIETNGSNLKVHTNNDEFCIKSSLLNMEHKLQGHGFMRVHKSFIVNLFSVDSIEKSDLILTNGVSVPFSRAKTAEIKDKFQRCLRMI